MQSKGLSRVFSNIVQKTVNKTIPMEKKCKKAKWLSGEALQIAVKREAIKAKNKSGAYKENTPLSLF